MRVKLPFFAAAETAASRRGKLMWALIVGAVLLALLLLSHFLAPLPPRSLVFSGGAEGGAYVIYAQRYREVLARHGVTMTILPSSGSLQNLRRLKGVDSVDGKIQNADVALLQGGIVHEPESSDLRTLGAMYYEPMWVFLRQGLNAGGLGQLRGQRIAIGVSGGGAQLLALEMLAANGFALDDPGLLPLGGEEAFNALLGGKIDALMSVNGIEAPLVQKLLHSPGIGLMDFEHADAYARRMQHLHRLRLPRGTIDLVGDKPPSDIRLAAPTANLVVRADLHPALVSLLMQAATEVHRAPGIFEDSNEFPAPRDHDLPPSEEAARYYRSGAPLLQRVLPFWAAVLIDRLMWTLIPLLALLIPASRIIPALLRWHARSRVYRWYGELRYLEAAARRSDDSEALRAMRQRLDEIEHLATRRSIPLAYANELYILREHIGLVRSVLSEAITGAEQAGAAAPAQQAQQTVRADDR